MQDPNKTISEIHQEFREKIDAFGRTFVGVSNTLNGEPAYIYTVGMQERHLPELIIIGNLPIDTSFAIILEVSKQLLSAPTVVLGRIEEFVYLQEGLKAAVELVLVDKVYTEAHYLHHLPHFYPSKSYDVVQILWPDTRGYMPHQPEYATGPEFHQPCLPPFQVEKKQMH